MTLRYFYKKANPKGNGAIILSQKTIPNIGEANWESLMGYFPLVYKFVSTKGFSQNLGIAYEEIFYPIERLDIVKTVLVVVAENKWPVHQQNVKSSFLNGILKEQVYVDQPFRYKVKGQENMVYRLKKALYGLNQAPRAQYIWIDSCLHNNGSSRSEKETTLYTKIDQQGNILIVCIYVDYIIYIGKLMMDEFRTAMKIEFEMTDLDLLKYFLGIEVEQSIEGIFIYQQKYASDILKRFKMDKCKLVDTPVANGTKLSKEVKGSTVYPTLYKRLVSSLMYLSST